MSEASINLGKLAMGVVIVALFMTFSCTEETPLSESGANLNSIVGIVKPIGTVALIKVLQGVLVDTTYSDSETGYFEIDNLQVGFYTLEIIATGYGKNVKNQIQVVADGVTSVGDIELSPFPEQILAIIPPGGSENIQLSDSCGFEFSVLMDHNSVEKNFTIIPYVQGHFKWKENTTQSALFFFPESEFRAYTNYSILLSTGVRTIYGDTLSFDFSSKFKTEPVKVEAYTPEHGSTYVLPEVSIYVGFNKAMNRISVENSFGMIQAADGSFLWHSNEAFSFRPHSFLATNTQYTVIVSTNAKDFSGTSLGETFTLNFSTEPLKITYTNPENGSTYIRTDTSFKIDFNSNVNQTATENAFSISPSVDGSFMWIDLTKFTYFPDSNLTPNTSYTITINTNCKDIYGKHLPETYSFNFETRNN